MKTEVRYTVTQSSVTYQRNYLEVENVEVCEEFASLDEALAFCQCLISTRDKYEVEFFCSCHMDRSKAYRKYVEEIEWEVDEDGELRFGVTVGCPYWSEFGYEEYRDSMMEGEDE